MSAKPAHDVTYSSPKMCMKRPRLFYPAPKVARGDVVRPYTEP